MAKKDEKIPHGRIAKTNRQISGNINSTLSELYSSIYGRPKRHDVEELSKQFSDTLKTEIDSLNDRVNGDLNTFLTRLFSQDRRGNTISQIGNIFSSVEQPFESVITEEHRTKMLKQSDIHEVASQLVELREAINITRDSILSSDMVEGRMSRTLQFGETADESYDVYLSAIEEVEKRLKLQDKIRDFIVPKTLEFGEYYAYTIPHSKIFADFERAKKAGILDIRESVDGKHRYIVEDNSFYLSEKVSDSTLQNLVIESTGLDKKNDYKEIGKLTKEAKDMLSHVEVCNDPIQLPFLESGEDSLKYYYEIVSNRGTGATMGLPSAFSRRTGIPLDDGTVDDLNNPNSKASKKIEEAFAEYTDCYIKFFDPMHMIEVKLLDEPFCYYAIMDEDATSVLGAYMMNTTMYTDAKYEPLNRNRGFIDAVADQIVQQFDKEFLKNNLEVKNLIVDALNYYNLRDKKIRIQYIPKEYIQVFKVNVDENGNGTSILEPALFYAQLYRMLTLFKAMTIVQNSNDVKVNYIRTAGIDKNITNKTEEIARMVQSRMINIYDLFSPSTLITKVGNGREMFVPVGRNGERPIETEILQGQDVQMNSDFLDQLRQSYISATGVPAVIMNYIHEAEFAKTIELGNSRYQARVMAHQLSFNSSITEWYQRIVRYTLPTVPEYVIEALEFTFSPPKYSKINTTNDLLQNFNSVSDFIINTMIPSNITNNDEDSSEYIAAFRRLLAKDFLPMLDWDKYKELLEEAARVAPEEKMVALLRKAKEVPEEGMM